MRNKKNVKIIAIALLCTLMIGAAIGIGISAETDKYDAEIGMMNLAYNAEMNLALELTMASELEESANEDGKLALGVWPANTSREDMTKTNAIWINDSIEKGTVISDATSNEPVEKDIYYALSQGIAAKDIKTVYTFAAVIIRTDGSLYIGEMETASVYSYLDARLNTAGITPEQKTLYKAVMAYGDAAKDSLFKEQK
jgi:hypothetical protein